MSKFFDILMHRGKPRDSQGDGRKDASTEQSPELTLQNSLVEKKVNPFLLQAIRFKGEHKGLKYYFQHRKRVENFYRRLFARYSDEGDEGDEQKAPESERIVQERTRANYPDDKSDKIEQLAKRMSLIRSSTAVMKRRRTTNVSGDELTGIKSSKYIPVETQMESPRRINDAITAQMARNRWQVAIGLAMGMQKMAAHTIHEEKEPFIAGDLIFQPNLFKADKNVNVLTADSKFILTQGHEKRTKEQVEEVARNLRRIGIKSFNEYPTSVQLKLVQIARYEVVSPLRVIIRQGRPAENFFFLIEGTVVAIERISKGKAKEDTEDLIILKKGEMFGETEMVNRKNRRATVISKGQVELLTIDRNDILKLFVTSRRPSKPPDHILFLKQCNFIKLWPIGQLIDDLDHCTPYFFKQNVLIVEDSLKNDFLVVIRSGQCRVIRKLYIRSLMLKKKQELNTKTNMRDVNDKLLHRNFCSFSRPGSQFDYVFGVDNFETKLRANTNVDQILYEKSIDIQRLGEKSKSRLQSHVSRCLPRHNSSKIKKSISRDNDRDTIDDEEDLENKLIEFEFAPKSRLEKALLMPTTYEYLLRENEKDNDNTMMPVYIQIDILNEKDVFGLDTLVFDRLYDKPYNTGLCLLSGEDEKGVDVVLLSKSYFIEHASEEVQWRVRHMMKSYPSTETLKNEIERQELWANYKQCVVENVIEKKSFYKKKPPWK